MSTSKNNDNNEFTFTKHDDIGAAAAEDDSLYLSDCFIDTGDLSALTDCNGPRRIVVGRTGSGKSALLGKINSSYQKNTIQISPHSLSLNYIANNDVISFFEEAGTNLSLFYSLLWRHVLVVELLKRKFNIRNEESQKLFMRHIRSIFYKKDHIKDIAVDYLEKWGNKFWLTTDERIEELTLKIETDLAGSISGQLPGVELTAEGSRKLSEEQKKKVLDLGKRVVSTIQVRELENLISILAEDIFDDPQENYYVTIDSLDEEWADSRIKIKLIRSLIGTIRHFKKVTNVKVIAALRVDLLDRVLHTAPEPGFQAEKFESLYLYVRWNECQLYELVKRRINFLVKRRYTKRPVEIEDILPGTVNGVDSIEYICNRTFLRPRDIILFLNECIALADGRPRLTADIIKHAEEQYSYKRLRSLAEEWKDVYPNLYEVSQVFYGEKCSFQVSEITREFLDNKYTSICESIDDVQADPLTRLLDSLYISGANFNSVRSIFLRELYVTGLIGIKRGPTTGVSWSYQSSLSVSSGDLKATSVIHLHPMFYRALGIRSGKNSL
jgi:hypothetical protein